MIYRQIARENAYFKGINKACHSHGVYLTFLLRVSAMLPYFLVSYLLSVTDIKLPHYLVGNLGFLVPSMLYMYLGASAKEILTFFTS